MPEADSVWRAAHRLNSVLSGTALLQAELRWPKIAGADLRGWRTVEVVPRGKHLLHRFDSGITLHSHLRMDGRWDVNAGQGRRPPDRSDVRTWLVTEVATVTGRRLGMLGLVPTRREGTVVGHLGPDILAEQWNRAAVSATLRNDSRAIGAALLDQRVIAGLGTMWISELLHQLRLHPWRPASELGEAERDELLGLARRWLWRAKDSDVPSSTGSQQRGSSTRVHGRSGRPCPRCGDTVRVAMIGEPPQDRTMFYCPSCQGGYGPTNDRRPQAPLGARRRP